MSSRERRLLGLGLPMALGLTLWLGTPQPLGAEARRAVDPGPWGRPAERAFTGGIAHLRAPVTGMLRVPRSTFAMGSTQLEVLETAASCRRAGAALIPPALQVPPEDVPECSELGLTDELPRHPVTLASFWIDRTEVSVADYQRCVAARRCLPPPYAEGGQRFARPELPVVLVTWHEAAAFCAFRGARLLTEAEFERAARGPHRRTFPWGERFHRGVANHGRIGFDPTDRRDGFGELAPVGSFPAGRTPNGILDLAGNVEEWVADYLGPYPEGAVTDPTGPASPLVPGATSYRVLRGGSYRSPPPMLRGASRRAGDPRRRAPSIGFRCARSAGDRAVAPTDG